MKIPPRPWADIVAHYRRAEDGQPYPGLQPMLDLAQRIEASPYSSGLVAYTSIWDLVIAQSEVSFMIGPELRISYDRSKSRFTFTYVERVDVKVPWTRIADADEGFEVLERFLFKRARWFKKCAVDPLAAPSPSSG